MFKLSKHENVVQMHLGDRKWIDNISVEAVIDRFDRRILGLRSLSEKCDHGPDPIAEYTLRFKDGEERIVADLIFRCRRSSFALRVDAQIENEERFKRQRHFAPRDGIIITFREGLGDYRFMANYQHKDWWTRPRFGKGALDVPPRTLSLLMGGEFGYGHWLPVSDSVTKTELRGTRGGLELSISNGQGALDRLSQLVLVAGVGADPYRLVEANVKEAFGILGNGRKIRKEKGYPEILDYLGWCTWDAFYHGVNEEGILKKAEEFQQKAVPVKWVMIDDGWMEAEGKKLKSFRADPEKFPGGLGKTVTALKETYGIRWAGVWHTIAGYWEGVDPDGPLAKTWKEYLFATPKGSLIPHPDTAKGFGFWHGWHSRLRGEGIDFLKVDSQSAVSHFLEGLMSVGEAAAGAHAALEASASLHFRNTVINCMGMAQESLWHRPASSVSRNSDDFVPQEAGSFREHALQNAYNSIFHGAFYWGDWDMYWTKNHDSLQNMVLRAVSGGPVYISDPVGETDPEKILPLVYRDGKIIRCEQPGLPMIDCLFTDPVQERKPLKVWNLCNGAGVIAAFHICEAKETICDYIKPSDIPGLSGDQFLAYDSLQKTARILGRDDSIYVELGENDVSLFAMVPLEPLFTPVGLMDKLVPTDAVLGLWRKERGAAVSLREGGRFGFWCESKPVKVLANGQRLEVRTTDCPGFYWIDTGCIPGEILVEMEME